MFVDGIKVVVCVIVCLCGIGVGGLFYVVLCW